MELNSLMLIPKVYLGKILFYLSFLNIILNLNRQIFCDFGENFTVVDTNGENPLTQIVTEISRVCFHFSYRDIFVTYICIII